MKGTTKGGFTLVELLVAITILGILSSIVVASLGDSRIGSRDAKRVSDLNGIKLALTLYYNDNLKYPASLSTLVPNYMSATPKDPDGSPYKYTCLTSPPTQTCGVAVSRYHLGAILENFSNAALNEDAALTQNAGGYGAAISTDTSPDFFGESPDCGGSSGSPDQCYDLSGY